MSFGADDKGAVLSRVVSIVHVGLMGSILTYPTGSGAQRGRMVKPRRGHRTKRMMDRRPRPRQLSLPVSQSSEGCPRSTSGQLFRPADGPFGTCRALPEWSRWWAQRILALFAKKKKRRGGGGTEHLPCTSLHSPASIHTQPKPNANWLNPPGPHVSQAPSTFTSTFLEEEP